MKRDPVLATVPVIVLSNKGEPQDIEWGKKLGAWDYLVKVTASPKRVLHVIDQALQARDSRLAPVVVDIADDEVDAARLVRPRVTTTQRYTHLEVEDLQTQVADLPANR